MSEVDCLAQDCRTSCIYRIAQEGLPLLLPWMGKQVVHVRAETLLRQLTEGSIALPESHRLPMEVICRKLSCWSHSLTPGFVVYLLMLRTYKF